MSIKTKLSLAISLMLVSAIILYHMLNEYSIEQGVKKMMHQSIERFSTQLAETAAGHWPPVSAGWEGQGPLDQLVEIQRNLLPHMGAVGIYASDTGELLYGDDVRAGSDGERFFLEAAIPDVTTLRHLAIDGVKLIRSYHKSEQLGGAVVGVDYYYSELAGLAGLNQDQLVSYIGLFLLAMIVIIYWLVGKMIRPLKAILWKVNEVSSVRFHQPIQIKGKDEFGLLALKINAMSQNLSIYMNKLRKAFEENRRMKEHLESFINHSNDAIKLMDLDGKVMQVNRAFEQLFGYEEAEVLGTRFPTVPDSHRMEMRQMIELLLAGKKLPAQETMRITRAGELIPVSVNVSPIRDSDGTIRAFASICRDMRSRNRMEELLRRSEKLTTVGQLAAGVAHEIRNPLTTLRGFLQLQQQTGALSLHHVDLMLSELDRINLIVGEFLILAKPQATKFIVKDVRDILKDVLVFLDSEAHLHNIVFRTVFTTEQCRIACEENQLKQVFINLLKNAIEAMPGGGTVHISIHRKNGSIAISITDEGVGIPENMISKIGDPFFTGKESGTGLGIMVSQRIVNSHNGTLDIQSQVNVGTSVKLTLPVLKEEVAK